MKNIFISCILILIFAASSYAQNDDFIDIDGGVLHYQTYGQGDPILVINGGPGMNCNGFAALAELLSDKNEVILFDQRGTGQSKVNKVDSTTITMDLMVDDIEKLREHLGFERWIVLGHSFGGILAQYYASEYPDCFGAMILSGSGGIDMDIFNFVSANIKIRLSETEKDSLNYYNSLIENGDTSYAAKYNKGRFLAPAYLYNREYVPQLAVRLTQGNSLVNGLVMKNLRKINYDCKKTLRQFSRPVLIIQGRQDIVGDGTAYKAHEVLKNSELVFLNECSHYGWLDQKEKYKEALDEFIGSVDIYEKDSKMNIQRERKSH